MFIMFLLINENLWYKLSKDKEYKIEFFEQISEEIIDLSLIFNVILKLHLPYYLTKGKVINLSEQKNVIHIFCTFNEKIEFEEILERLFFEYLHEKSA